MLKHEDHLALAIQLCLDNVHTRKGGPFGTVLVKDDQIVATGVNAVLSSHDPTAHAELEAIPAAAGTRQNPRLDGRFMNKFIEAIAMSLYGGRIHD